MGSNPTLINLLYFTTDRNYWIEPKRHDLWKCAWGVVYLGSLKVGMTSLCSTASPSTILAKAKANIANESVQSQSFSLDRSKQIRHPEESEGTEEISCLLTVRKTNS